MDSVLRITAVAALLSSFGAMLPAHAGLGPIRVLSAAGEPFEAEIPLVDESINANALIGLADRNRYPLITPYSPSVGQLQFSLVRQPDGALSKVHVAGPANFDESTLHFAVEISWPAGRLVREFEVDYRRDGPRQPKHRPLPDDEGKKAAVTVDHQGRLAPLGLGELKVQSSLGEPLLAEVEVLGRPKVDLKRLSAMVLPNGVSGTHQASLLASIEHEFVQTASGKVLLRLFSSRTVEDPVLPLRLEVGVGSVKVARDYSLLFSPASVAASEESDTAPYGGKTKLYRVSRGDTLGAIAQRTKGGGSVDQVMRRLQAANPQAFIGGDANKLKAGAQLAYPSGWHIAPAAVAARHPARNDTERVPPVAVSTATPMTAAPASVVEPAPVAAAKPAPVVVPPPKAVVPAADGGQAASPDNTAAREEQLKRRLQQQDQLLAAAEQRLQALQQRVKALQHEGGAQPPAAPKPPDGAPTPAAHQPPAKGPEPKAEPEKGVLDGMVETVGGDTALYAAGAAGVALLGGGLWWLRRRNAREGSGAGGLAPSSQVGDSPSLLTMGPLTTLMAGGKQGAGIDLSPVDLVAEAEVYLAYGRTDQALTLLREGLVKEPMRQDLRFKLLEALSTLPDKEPFILEATTAKGVFGKDSTLWQRVCEMGRVIEPDNPLFEITPSPLAEGLAMPLAPLAPSTGASPAVRADAPATVGGVTSPVPAGATSAAVPPPAETLESAAPDKRELARLYMEMGDTEAANALLKESKDSA
ncbi:FimV/HubP family polar landmark protein [Pseudogulbenkiania sp. MAI-1]|uniref:FimV/HubP family polar landmark protein n=1 Tax=Pseudogulbenkiania sp. MAI-1 TaxID=990370 RepID=UPI00045EB7D8|nr:FimV/HubP family polar landmark protein [Pseudogulbenkiania sp. MAI-1]